MACHHLVLKASGAFDTNRLPFIKPCNDPRAAKLPGACCHEANIIHDCSDPEFKNEGFKCVEKGQCFDKFEGKSKLGVKFNEVFIKSEDGRCPSKNQICCRKDEKPIEEFAKMETCEEHEGIFTLFVLKNVLTIVTIVE